MAPQMKCFGSVLLFLCMVSTVSAQKDTAWIYTYGGAKDDACNQVIFTRDGGYAMIGNTASFGAGATNMYIIKTDSMCKPLWTAAIGSNAIQTGMGITQTFDGGYACVGFTDGSGNGGYDVFVVLLDSLGHELWQKKYGGSDWDFGYSIKQTDDSGFIICGLTYSYGAGNGDVYIIRTNKNGDTLWTKAVGGSGYDVGNTLTIRNDSLYLIAGATTSYGRADTNAYFIELNSNGNIISSKTYGSAFTSEAYSITPTVDGGYMMMGSIDSIYHGIIGEMFLKTDSIGNYQWMTQVTNGTWDDMGRDVKQATDSTYFSIGTSDGGGYGSSSVHIMRHTPTGYYLAGPSMGGSGAQFGNSVTIGRNGDILFAGASNSYGNGGFDVYAIRLTHDSMIQNYTQVFTNYKDTPVIEGIAAPSVLNIGIKAYPDPATTEATILVQTITLGSLNLSLYNNSGAPVFSNNELFPVGHGLYSAHINTSGFPAGVYYYKVSSNSGIGSGKFEVIR